MTQFSKILDDRMSQMGISSRELAFICGVSHVAVSNWRHGRTTPYAQHIGTLAQTLEMTNVETALSVVEPEQHASHLSYYLTVVACASGYTKAMLTSVLGLPFGTLTRWTIYRFAVCEDHRRILYKALGLPLESSWHWAQCPPRQLKIEQVEKAVLNLNRYLQCTQRRTS